MKESGEITWRFAHGTEGHTKDIGGSSSQLSGPGIRRGLRRSFNTREVEISFRGIDPYMFSRKQKSIKSMFSAENVKKIRKSWQTSSTTMQYHSIQLIVVLIIRP